VTKDAARAAAYRRLREAGAARFPFPIEGRIPNFRGAEAAAARLRQLPLYRRARVLKINPDAPQLPVRAMALEDGKTVYMPSPRLRGSFVRLRPGKVPPGEARKAASLKHCLQYGEEVGLDELEAVDLVVVGSVAVSARGARAGKGEGYSDMEYAILRELGHPPAPVVTTVHGAQVLDEGHIPMEPHDLSVDVIVTPDGVIETNTPYPKPEGIRWDMLGAEDLDAMPVLRELRRLRWERAAVPDLLKPGLRVLFVGVNPGRWSASAGCHFAGPGNHFWRLLHEAGFTPRRYAPSEGARLLELGLGITNVVSRPTRSEGEIRWEEFVAGGRLLREKAARFRPRIVALLGKHVYRAYAGLARTAPVSWGLQPTETVPGVREFVAPNPSPRSTVPYGDRLALFRDLASLAADDERFLGEASRSES